MSPGVTHRVATSEERLAALIAGSRGSPEYRYRLYRSNISGDQLEEIPVPIEGLSGAVVSVANCFREWSWALELPARLPVATKLDPLSDYLKLVVELRDGSEWLAFPFGVYRFSFPSLKHTPTSTSWTLFGHSLESVLLKEMASTGYRVAANSLVLATVRQILIDRGIPASRIRFPGPDVSLPTDMFFDPFSDANACYWLRIANALLAAGGYYPLFTDASGVFKTLEMADFTRRTPDVTYGSRTPGGRMISGEDGEAPFVLEESDDGRFANRVVVYSANSQQTTPVVGVAENHDPLSPGSIENLGRVVSAKPIRFANIIDTAQANALARAELKKVSGLDRKVTFRTLPDPRRKPREAYGLDLQRDDGTQVLSGNWEVVRWEFPLDGQAMKHQVTRTMAL